MRVSGGGGWMPSYTIWVFALWEIQTRWILRRRQGLYYTELSLTALWGWERKQLRDYWHPKRKGWRLGTRVWQGEDRDGGGGGGLESLLVMEAVGEQTDKRMTFWCLTWVESRCLWVRWESREEQTQGLQQWPLVGKRRHPQGDALQVAGNRSSERVCCEHWASGHVSTEPLLESQRKRRLNGKRGNKGCWRIPTFPYEGRKHQVTDEYMGKTRAKREGCGKVHATKVKGLHPYASTPNNRWKPA